MQIAMKMDKDLIIQLQQNQLHDQVMLIDKQDSIIKLLEARIVELENNHKKNSSNSSKPPGSDIGKIQRTQSLRTRSGKKPAGQYGHPGQTLSFSATPNEVIVHAVRQCSCCGKSLSGKTTIDYECRASV